MKLITWNIQWGRGIDGRVDLARILAHARAIADFDVLCLQEVADNFPELEGNDAANQFAALADLLPGFAAVEGIAVDIPDPAGRRQRFGNLVLTRYPVGQVLRYTLPWEADATRNMARSLIEAVLTTPAGPLRIMTTHLEYSSDRIRRAQVEGVREAHRTACARVAHPREMSTGTYRVLPSTMSGVLTGDFNMKPDDPVKRRISEPFPDGTPPLLDAWEAVQAGTPHPPSSCLYDQTYGEPHCCDFVFVTPDLVPRIRRIAYDLDTQASDHQPILLELDLG